MDEATATAFMLAVHQHGKGVAATYTRDVAETKAAAVMEYARENDMPLLVTAEPDTSEDK
jgi:ATP-dependent Clp protease adaptor protein ClpS